MLGNETFLPRTVIVELLIHACGGSDLPLSPNEELTKVSVQNGLTQTNQFGA